eukprot:CAMPEP_0119278072 /NCGR_PEP_ID=MMETSP1329-20130426/18434_1 /TAXON_ID=114041 /ORGANISM="Genus nov. species nov., Strain RCC1024" /LENGTH=183 /DNA_ID=CAMNT_0007278573 /DNA_START=100 /DNA_END=648 /DNA_ORIENTATION=-
MAAVLVKRYQVPKKRRAEFVKLATELATATRGEAGCEYFELVDAGLHAAGDGEYVAVERYASEAAHQAHLASPHAGLAEKMTALAAEVHPRRCADVGGVASRMERGGYHVVTHATVFSWNRDDWLAYLEERGARMRGAGCLSFAAVEAVDEPGHFVIVEAWASRAALAEAARLALQPENIEWA